MKERCVICYWFVDYRECHKRAPVEVDKIDRGAGANEAIWPRIHMPHEKGCGDFKLNEEILCPHCNKHSTLCTIENKKCFFCMKEWNGWSLYAEEE